MNTRTLNSRIKEFKNIKAQIDDLNTQLEKLKDSICNIMHENEINEYTGTTGTVKITCYERSSFDVKEFKKDHPKIANKYMIVTEATRVTIK